MSAAAASTSATAKKPRAAGEKRKRSAVAGSGKKSSAKASKSGGGKSGKSSKKDATGKRVKSSSGTGSSKRPKSSGTAKVKTAKPAKQPKEPKAAKKASADGTEPKEKKEKPISSRNASKALEGKWTQRTSEPGIRGQPFRKLISFYCGQKAKGLRFAHNVMHVLQTGIEQRIVQYMMQAAIMAIGARRHTVNDNDIEAVSSLELAENGDTEALNKYIKVMKKAEEKRAKKAAATKAANAVDGGGKPVAGNTDGKAEEASDKPAKKMKAVRAAKKAKTAAASSSSVADSGMPPLIAVPAVVV